MKYQFKILFTTLLFVFFAGSIYAQKVKYPKEITVSQNGNNDYKTIQEAINSVRDLGQERVTIFIKNGTYKEKILIPSSKTNLTLIGESAENTIITGDDYSGKVISTGKDAVGLDKISTFTSSTVLIQGNGITLENLTIENTAGRVGQAVALHVEGDKITVKNCRILGNQDTLYTADESSRQYYENCYIEGTTDFIFGEATVVFQSCTIKSLADSYITAAATRPDQKFGYVFFDCTLTADPGVKVVYLGRPWRPFAKTVFIRTEMGSHIIPEGWNPWKGDVMFPDKEKTAYYGEYASKGPGALTAQRVEWSKQLSKKELKQYTLNNIFGSTQWLNK
ncbi:pectinesterase family protein [Arcticibacter eurypsychrophilus]|uniref:pectinesterase family protein n=1 Tax=Arcticibacter eurypsychrophilus TaxID=1434752 RepID=UPI00084DC273|nr:pectinesterase family protein [Arcticibacter eurypsychrophilus]